MKLILGHDSIKIQPENKTDIAYLEGTMGFVYANGKEFIRDATLVRISDKDGAMVCIEIMGV